MMEILTPGASARHSRVVLFDFDGTLSLRIPALRFVGSHRQFTIAPSFCSGASSHVGPHAAHGRKQGLCLK